ncbi:MAG: glycoside hydrolase family 13 protein [Bacteroidota bacterium]
MRHHCLLALCLLIGLSFLPSCTPKVDQAKVEAAKELPEPVDTLITEEEDPAFERFPEGVQEAVYRRRIPDGTSFGERKMVPPFWWVGMKNPSFELIIYDRLIKGYRVSIKHKGVTIKQVESLENPNYLFVKIEVGPEAIAGPFKIVLTRGDDVRVYDYELRERRSTAKAQGLTNADCIYLIMPDRFANGDATNDEVSGMQQMGIDRGKFAFRHGGDLKGIIQKLDYLQDLGVTALWLNPVLENNQPYESYHGYAISNHYQIDARMGTNEDYVELVEQCHKRGMKVVMDIVHNHVGDQHWMIRDLPSEDWIHQFDEFRKTSYRATTIMDPYAAPSDRDQMVNAWFDTHMPDLNQENPHVANYLLQNNIWWTEYAGHDAYRIDTYAYPDAKFSSEWAQSIQSEYPKLGLFGETWVHGVMVQSYFTGNNRLTKGIFDSHLPAVTDFQLHYAILESLQRKQGWTEGLSRIYYTLAKDFVYDDPYRNVLFLDNHDLQRVYTAIGEDYNKFKSGMALLLSIRGIPCMYYGTEILMTGAGGAFGEGGRRDFPGGWAQDPTNKFTKAGRTPAEQEAFEYVQRLLTYRRTCTALQDGKLMQYVPQNDIYAFFRYDDKRTILVLTNSSDQPQSVDTKRYVEMMKDFRQAYDITSDRQLSQIDKIEIDRNTTLWLELRK